MNCSDILIFLVGLIVCFIFPPLFFIFIPICIIYLVMFSIHNSQIEKEKKKTEKDLEIFLKNMSTDNIAIKRAEMEVLANSPFASEMEKANAKFFNDFVDKNGYLNGYNYNIDTYDIQNQDTMNLQDAILETLKSNGKPMTCQEIADSLNSSKLYTREDGEDIPASQVSARVNNYPLLFIKDKSAKPMKISAR